MDLAVSADHRIKLKEIEKRDKYQKLCLRTVKKPSTKNGVKNFQKSKIIIIIIIIIITTTTKKYDMVPRSWIIDCLKMYKISGKVIKFMENTMQNWRVELTPGRKSLTVVKILSGIFLGDALSPLLFVIAMMPLSHIQVS